MNRPRLPVVIALSSGFVISAAASAQFVNGDFETGDFTAWTLVGDQTYNAVNTGQWVDLSPHGGNYEAHFGPIEPNIGGIQQAVTAQVGDLVTIDFWYGVDSDSTPNSFLASFNGQTLISFTDDTTNTSWTEFNFPNIAVTVDNPVLMFNFQNSPAYDYLDDIVVTVTHPTVCYANCDHSTGTPFLNVADFTCFLQKFATGDAYANCDGSTSSPVLNVADFTCFFQKFALGCSAP